MKRQKFCVGEVVLAIPFAGISPSKHEIIKSNYCEDKLFRQQGEIVRYSGFYYTLDDRSIAPEGMLRKIDNGKFNFEDYISKLNQRIYSPLGKPRIEN